MASRGKKKTTFAKLSREARLREKREDKQARKLARREEALREQVEPEHDAVTDALDDSVPSAHIDA